MQTIAGLAYGYPDPWRLGGCLHVVAVVVVQGVSSDDARGLAAPEYECKAAARDEGTCPLCCCARCAHCARNARPHARTPVWNRRVLRSSVSEASINHRDQVLPGAVSSRADHLRPSAQLHVMSLAEQR
jgi:hypothetical protein